MDINLKRVKVGSIVTLRGVVKRSTQFNVVRVLFDGSAFESNIDEHVKPVEVEDAPCTVGDRVNVDA